MPSYISNPALRPSISNKRCVTGMALKHTLCHAIIKTPVMPTISQVDALFYFLFLLELSKSYDIFALNVKQIPFLEAAVIYSDVYNCLHPPSKYVFQAHISYPGKAVNKCAATRQLRNELQTRQKCISQSREYLNY